ncbi:putative reverse transcriptase domain-containing protein [Tanacetum coccineum]
MVRSTPSRYILSNKATPVNSKAEEEEREREGNPEDTNTIAYNREQRDTPQLERKDTTALDNLGPNRDDEGIEWLDVEEPLDLVDTSEESVYESLIKEMPKRSLNYEFRIKKGDPGNLKIPCMIGHKFTANAYINVDLPMNIMSLMVPEPRIMPPRRFKKKSVKRIVEKRVAKAIKEYEKTRADSNNTGGSGSANTGGTVAPDVQGCSYKTFMNGKPHSFSGTEGVCAEDDKSNVKAMMTTEYCPATEIQRMEQELWTLTLKGDDIEAYNNRFHELVLMCPELVSTEKKKIEKYIRGFPEGIKGNVTSSKPATLHDAINMARELIEQGVQAKALRIGDSNKRKWEDQQGNNYHQQQNRRQEAAKVYVAAPAKGRGYAGNLPWCNRCKTHHQPGPCPPRCGKCHKLGHQEGECRTRIPPLFSPPVAGGNSLQNVTCFGCGNQGHYRSAENEEQRDTPQLELKDTTAVDNLGPNRVDEGIEWLDVEEPLDLVDTSEESVYESLIKEMPKC